MPTRNITLSLSDDLIRRAKVLAAERDTSVSALVSELLGGLVGDARDYATEWAEEERLMAEGVGLRIGEITWSRDDAHAR